MTFDPLTSLHMVWRNLRTSSHTPYPFIYVHASCTVLCALGRMMSRLGFLQRDSVSTDLVLVVGKGAVHAIWKIWSFLQTVR